MSQLDPHIFRAYDIRGKAHEQISKAACLLVGKAFGSIVREMYKKDRPSVVVGRDARTHGPELETALIEGLVSTGCEVLTIGETPSPVNYFTICNQQLDAGVQVTASHNPAEDNGLKLQVREAEAFSGDSLQVLRQRIESGDFLEGEGSVEEIDALTTYKEHLIQKFDGAIEGLSVCVDGGNGVAGEFYSDVLRGLGLAVSGLYLEPDGTFPNHAADPSKWDTLRELQEKVVAEEAHCGFAYDGDGDRVGLIDEKGQIRTADDILLLLARDHLSRLSGAPVVFTVSNSSTLQTEIEKWGGKPVMCSVGHSFVEHAMRDNRSLLGGEQSGHFFCGENYFGFDDALVTTLWILKILQESGGVLSELFHDFPATYQSPEQRPGCPDDKKSAIIAQVTKHFQKEYSVETMDGARIDFGDGAWAGIRQSNTSPCLSVCIEARSEEKLSEVESLVWDHLSTYEDIDK